MRAKVAKSAGGHALEERFLKLSEIELSLLYLQANKEEEQANKVTMELVKTLNEAWTKKFEHFFEMQQLFSNPDLYKHKLQMKETEKLRNEIDEDSFLEEWDKLMEVIPEQYIVEEPSVEEAITVKDDPEFDELLAGWVDSSKRFKKE